jgi:hypothetical protein
MIKAITIVPYLCLLWTLQPKEARAQVFQALAQRDGVYNLSDYNGSRLILERTGDVLSTVQINAGRLDLTRAAGETRSALLVRLHRAGMRRLIASSQDTLFLQPFGALAPIEPQGSFVQVLAETPEGYSLTDWSDVTIVDKAGTPVAKVRADGGPPRLVPGPDVTVAQLYDGGLRVVALGPHRLARLEKDSVGAIRLHLAP